MAPKLPKIKINRFAVIMTVAIVLAGVAAYLAIHYLQNSESRYQAQIRHNLLGRLTQVVVPKGNLAPGTIASPADMALRMVPKDLIYPDTITVANWPEFAGHSVTREVLGGLPLQVRDFAVPYGGDFASTMPKNTRAITVDIGGANRIAGLIRPGDRVDLMVIVDQTAGGGKLVPVIHRALVVATGKHTRFTPVHTFGPRLHYVNNIMAQYSSLTLELTPVQTARVAMAQKVGELRVILVPKKATPWPQVPTFSGAEVLSEAGLRGLLIHRHPSTVQYIVGRGNARLHTAEVALGRPMPAPARLAPKVPPTMTTSQRELRQINNYLNQQRKSMQKNVNNNPNCPPYCGARPEQRISGGMPR
ncbi:MAG: Flp pilus assembly protein CpaB [Gammaproteobacteria bacterium]